MKKRLFLLPLAAFALASCGGDGGETPAGHKHVDANFDHYCDDTSCNKKISDHADSNKDHVCEYCGSKMSEHSDANSDGSCDVCGESMGGSVVGQPFQITLATTGYDASKYTYSLDPVEFQAGGASWTSSGVGDDSKGTWGGVTSQYNPDWVAGNPNGVMQFKKATGYILNKSGVSGFTKVVISWQATYDSEGTKYFPQVEAGASADSLTKAACEQTDTLSGTSLGYKSGKEGDANRYDVYGYETSYTLTADQGYFKISFPGSTGYISSISFQK